MPPETWILNISGRDFPEIQACAMEGDQLQVWEGRNEERGVGRKGGGKLCARLLLAF